MRLFFRIISIPLGLLAGQISKKIANRLWSLVDEEEPPRANVEEAPWGKILTAAAVQGAAFFVTRAIIQRGGAKGIHHLTGIWPGQRRPEPK